MLEMKTHCESCSSALPAASDLAYICSYECTYCHKCAKTVHQNSCPNCGGEFQKRPKRNTTQIN